MEFTLKDIIQVLDVQPPRLQTWLKGGWIEPSLQKAEGYGTRNVYALGDLYMIALFKLLVEYGIQRNLVGEFLRCLDKVRGLAGSRSEQRDPAHYSSWAFFFPGEEPPLAFFGEAWPGRDGAFWRDDKVALHVDQTSAAIVVNLRALRHEVDAKIAETEREGG